MNYQIKHEISAPMSPHLNRSAERQWRILFKVGHCKLLDKDLPKYLWSYAIMTAACTRNRRFNTHLLMCVQTSGTCICFETNVSCMFIKRNNLMQGTRKERQEKGTRKERQENQNQKNRFCRNGLR